MLKIGEIVQTIKGIIETRIGLVKQEIQDEFVGILSRLILLIIIGSMLLLVFLFLSLSLAFFLSQVTKSPYLGFLIVALMYFLVVLVLFLSRDSLKIQEKLSAVLKDFIFQIKNNKEDE
ncbi:phage holin family protein [Algoriphagus lacus]|mgnify:CR=1 FL=1|uniref:Phage holin family protein n=1 Tax=Algoriphagus lacus TaxID=2056311 RepID=A0A418PWT5_9BACT|nr:phage holin family protein [Algoriphagus lacus]RIW18535.1 phage holin family protein [Algoriphagus lacus]